MSEPATLPSPPVETAPASDYSAWSVAISAARSPRIKSAEMIAALDTQWHREGMSARAAALCNGGEFNTAHLRRIVALEQARDTLERVAGVFVDLPPKIKKAILGG